MLSYDAVENQSNFSQIEKAVLRAKREWEATFDAIPEMLILTNSEGRIARCNEAAMLKLRGSYGELVGKKFSDLFPEVAQANASGIELQLFDDRHWYRVSVLPVKMGNESTRQIHVFQDVSRKKSYELEILKEEQYFEALFMSLPDSAAALDANGIVRCINPAFQSTFGFSTAEAKGHPIKSLLTSREFRVAGSTQASGSGQGEFCGTFRCAGKDGRAFLFSIREQPVNLNSIDHGKLAIFRKLAPAVDVPAGSPIDNSAREALMERLENKLLPVLQSFEELSRSLANDALTPKQIMLKTTAYTQADQLRQLMAEIRTQQIAHSPKADPSIIKAGLVNPVEPQRINTAPTAEKVASKSLSRILLVEDNPINQKLMLRLLQKRGCVVTVADNGLAALRILVKQSFEIIFMDVQMPEMDGIETTRRIRVREHDDQHQVIIALTAEGPGGDRMECLRAGMDDYLAKPVDIDQLYAMLEKYAPTSALSTSEVHVIPTLVDPPESGTVNVTAALPRFGGELEVYFDFLNHFIKQLKQTDQKLRAAYKNGDIEQLHAISHGLKGTAANFEAKNIRDLAGSLEEMTSNNTLVGAYSLINEISSEIPQMEAFYHNQMLLRKKKPQVLSASVGA